MLYNADYVFMLSELKQQRRSLLGEKDRLLAEEASINNNRLLTLIDLAIVRTSENIDALYTIIRIRKSERAKTA